MITTEAFFVTVPTPSSDETGPALAAYDQAQQDGLILHVYSDPEITRMPVSTEAAARTVLANTGDLGNGSARISHARIHAPSGEGEDLEDDHVDLAATASRGGYADLGDTERYLYVSELQDLD